MQPVLLPHAMGGKSLMDLRDEWERKADTNKEAPTKWLAEAEQVVGNVWANRYVMLALAHQNLEALLDEAHKMIAVWYCYKDSREVNQDQAAQVADWIKRVTALTTQKAQTPPLESRPETL